MVHDTQGHLVFGALVCAALLAPCFDGIIACWLTGDWRIMTLGLPVTLLLIVAMTRILAQAAEAFIGWKADRVHAVLLVLGAAAVVYGVRTGRTFVL